MADWKDQIRKRLAHLPDSTREATIAQVIADTEAGRPFAGAADQPRKADPAPETDPAPTARAGAADVR